MSLDFRDRQLIKELSGICRNVLGKEGYQFNSFENDFKDGTNLLKIFYLILYLFQKMCKNVYHQLIAKK